MGNDEVLAAGFPDQAWVGTIGAQVSGHRVPQMSERCRGPGEVDAGQVWVGYSDLTDGLPGARHHVDHAGWQSGGLQQAHRVVRGQLLGGCRLPNHRVAHQRRRRRQVTGDGSEVERCDREDETLQRAVVQTVPHAAHTDRLLLQQLSGVGNVEPPEVRQLAGSIDLCLIAGLALPEHGCGVQRDAPWPGQQVGSLEEDRRSVVE